MSIRIKPLLALASLILPLVSCNGETPADNEVMSMYVHGEASEGLSEASRIKLGKVYGPADDLQDGLFEIFLDFTPGEIILEDDGGRKWGLSSDGTASVTGTSSTLSLNGLHRLVIDTKSGRWHACAIQSVTFRALYGERQTVEGVYNGKGSWTFGGISLDADEGQVKYYRFEVASEHPEEISYLCSVSDQNGSDPESYRSTYQFIRILGSSDINASDDKAASFRFISTDKGTATVTLNMVQSNARYMHYVEITPPGPPAAFMGDSITENWRKSSTGHPEFFSDNGYLNKGISGQNSTQILARFEQDIIAESPQTVIICCGTNDIAGNGGVTTNDYILSNISAMAQMATQAHIKVILCSLLPCNYYYWATSVHPEDRIADLNEKIRNLALSNGYPYVDYYTPMVDADRGLNSAYTSDRCHPNQAGYTVMEGIVKPVIDSLVK
ncbi:MAG: GDSL-type esterase/lipase family protein [Candidatus Cryptobacteroides sp.]